MNENVFVCVQVLKREQGQEQADHYIKTGTETQTTTKYPLLPITIDYTK